jgi:hypothetical protein
VAECGRRRRAGGEDLEECQARVFVSERGEQLVELKRE